MGESHDILHDILTISSPWQNRMETPSIRQKPVAPLDQPRRRERRGEGQKQWQGHPIHHPWWQEMLQPVYLCKTMYILNQFVTNCRKLMIPFHAMWGLCLV